MRTTVEPLEGNRVKLSVELEEAEFERELDAAFKRIAREVRIPGFRPGKVPRRILEARLGPEVARQEALREALPGYYARAIHESDVDVIAAPEIDITAGEETGPVAFDAVVEVRPRVVVPGYASLRVTIPGPAVTDEEVDAQVERLRSQFGELQSVERPARDGDHVSIDVAGSADGEPVEGLTADDYLYQVGSEAVVPELDQQLRGAKVGAILAFDAENPADGEGGPISFRVLVKDVKEQLLPDVDDEWANEASEFETLAELRDDLRGRLTGIKRVQSQMALQQGVLSALVELVEEDPPEPMVRGEVERRLRDMAERLSSQGVTIAEYLESTGRSPQELEAELRTAAASSVKADLALRAVADAEAIEADDEYEAELARFAEQMGEKEAAIRRRLEGTEQEQAIRSDLRKGKALAWLVEHAEVVDEDGRPIDPADLEPTDRAPQQDDTALSDTQGTEDTQVTDDTEHQKDTAGDLPIAEEQPT